LRKLRPSPASRETTSWSSESVAITWATESVYLASAASLLQGNPKPGQEDVAASSPYHLHGALKKTTQPHPHLGSNCRRRPYFRSSLQPSVPPPEAPTTGAPRREGKPPGSTRSGRRDLAPSSWHDANTRHDADIRQLANTPSYY
jgi:hypothetical protein